MPQFQLARERLGQGLGLIEAALKPADEMQRYGGDDVGLNAAQGIALICEEELRQSRAEQLVVHGLECEANVAQLVRISAQPDRRIESMAFAPAREAAVGRVHERPNARRTALARRLVRQNHLGQASGTEMGGCVVEVGVACETERRIYDSAHRTQRLDEPSQPPTPSRPDRATNRRRVRIGCTRRRGYCWFGLDGR